MTRGAGGGLIDKVDAHSYLWEQKVICEVPEMARGINLEFTQGPQDRQIGDSSVGLDLSLLRKEFKLGVPKSAYFVAVYENNERRMGSPDKPLIKIGYFDSNRESINFSEQIFDNILCANEASNFLQGMMELYSKVKKQ